MPPFSPTHPRVNKRNKGSYAMSLPFTQDQFLNVFQNYNNAVSPMQIVFVLLGLTAIYLAARRQSQSDRIIAAILSFFWLWMAVVYHLIFFTAINPAAYLFAFLFALQGALFIFAGLLKGSLSFRYTKNVYGITGAFLLAYALAIYPMLGYLFGHSYPNSPTFGLPCPTTIFTFGLLLWTDRRVPIYVLVIPLLWSFLGASAASSLGIFEDLGLFVAGVVATVMIVIRNRRGEFSQKAEEMTSAMA
jgi:hypothetical protein